MECEKCEGYGYQLMGSTEYGPYFWFDEDGNKILCSVCNGTGEMEIKED